MKEVLLNFPNQVRDAAKASWKVELLPKFKPSSIVICGMGGSAIGGDLLAGLLKDQVDIPVFVNRDYGLPNFVGERTFVFISSYSGNTEETLSAYKEATYRTKNIVCITSGGKLASSNPKYILKVPSGYQPRCALGWLLIPMIVFLHRLGLIRNPSSDLEESIELLSRLGEEFGNNKSNPHGLAKKLMGKMPIIYSDLRFGAVARRWAGQLNENAKQFAHFNVFSELNHNEIVGCGEPKIPCLTVLLKDKGYNERIKLRIEITKRIISPYTKIEEIESKGESLLARFFSLIYFGDWTSYWLATLKNIDPTPVGRIEWLKKELTK